MKTRGGFVCLFASAAWLIGSAGAEVKLNRTLPDFEDFTGTKICVMVKAQDAASARNLPRGTTEQRDKIVEALKKKGYEPLTEKTKDTEGYLIVQYKIYQTGSYSDSYGRSQAAGYAVVQFGLYDKKKKTLWQAAVEYNPGSSYYLSGGMTLIELCFENACNEGTPLIPPRPGQKE